jgi:thioredoxin-like negative regulator of GroEL
MRVLIACILLLITPSAVLIGVKVFEQYRALQNEEQAVDGIAHKPGEVLFFNATWCGPCRQMKPIVTQLRRQGYRLRDIDVDKNRGLAQKYGIRGIPTFVFVKNGTEVHRFSGGTSADELRKLCSSPSYH